MRPPKVINFAPGVAILLLVTPTVVDGRTLMRKKVCALSWKDIR